MKPPKLNHRLRRVLIAVTLSLSLLPNPVQAQELPGPPTVPGLPDPGQIGGDVCNAVGDVCDWVGFALSLAEQLQGLMDQFHSEIAGMGEDFYGEATGWLKDSLASLSMGVDKVQVDAAFANIEQAIKAGPSALRAATRASVRKLTQQRYATQHAPANSPDGRFDEMTRTLPNVAAAEIVTAAEQEETAALKAEAAAVTETSWKLGAVAQQNTAATDTATSILAPGGDADTLEDDVSTAVSTRAAVQALTEGVADLMRHNATFESNLAESVKLLAQQQVMTNWELQLAAQALLDEREKKIAEERAKLEMEVNGLYEESEQLAGEFADVVTAGAHLLSPDTAGLNPGALGW